jgi:uncharacterized membrane protein
MADPESHEQPRATLALAEQDQHCGLCDRVGGRRELLRFESIRPEVAKHIARRHSDARDRLAFLCRGCLQLERIDFVLARLTQERGDLSRVEVEIARHAGEHLLIAKQLDEEFSRTLSFGERAADRVARLGGSWAFVIVFVAALGAWLALNARLGERAFDPYPYILLNLVLSFLAALQAPIIMMAQNRRSARDRAEADSDYRVNLKAEIEVASLHEKVDHLLHSQWEHMVELQQLQIELLQELAPARRGLRRGPDAQT